MISPERRLLLSVTSLLKFLVAETRTSLLLQMDGVKGTDEKVRPRVCTLLKFVKSYSKKDLVWSNSLLSVGQCDNACINAYWKDFVDRKSVV